MSWWRRLNQGILIQKTEGSLGIMKNGYRFDKRIFRIAIFLVIGLGVLSFFMQGGPSSWTQVYAYCPPETSWPGCENPFFHDCPWPACEPLAELEYLPPGYEYGTRPKGGDGMILLMLGLVVMAFIINHVKHNKGRPFLGVEL